MYNIFLHGEIMSSGIYALYWWEQDLIYIGQAINLNRRNNEHFKKLNANKHSNYKVQEAYNSYGYPEFIVLETCSIDNLNTLEIFWQNEFQSLKSLDIVTAGDVGKGVQSNASKYSKFTILKVFLCLISTKYKTCLEIADKCKVPVSLVYDIYSGVSHTWLKDVYPEKYSMMKNISYRESSYNTLYKYSKVLISPDKKLFEVTNSVIASARLIKEQYYPEDTEEVIRKGLSRVLSGIRNSWRGWTLSKLLT